MKVPRWLKRKVERRLKRFAREIRDTSQALDDMCEIVRLQLLCAGVLEQLDYARNGGHDKPELREEARKRGIIK